MLEVMESMNWLTKATKEQSVNAIALKSGLVQSTLNTRAKADSLTADQVIAICRAYRYPVTQGLLDLGFITEKELQLPAIHAALHDATDRELVDEIARRLEQGHHEEFDKPIQASAPPHASPNDETT